MESREIYKNISSLDHRYSVSSPDLFETLSNYLSEDASVRYCVKAEAALLGAHLRHSGLDRPEYFMAVQQLPEQVSPDEVYAEEAVTRHNIRALVNSVKKHLPEEIRHLVHLGATSVDILDTAMAMRLRDVMQQVILPLLSELETGLCDLAEREAETPQIGRTHGRHAVPITFGYAVAEYVSRLGKSIGQLSRLSSDVRGKLSGAVGAYNAMSMITPDPEEFEAQFLAELGLAPTEYATQLVEPEYQLRLLLELNTAFGIIANLADDLRHLQRSEIDEVRESFGSAQVGSSTMPQKRNPWNCEHVKSLWKAFSPRVMTFFMDQISEHQRDLSNSASSRFVSDYVTGFGLAADRMKSIIGQLGVDRERMLANLRMTGDMVLAEPLYVLLAAGGESEAHERVKQLTLESEKSGKSVVALLQQDETLWERLKGQMSRVGIADPQHFVAAPESYRGRAAERARRLAARWRTNMREMTEALNKDA